MSRVDTSTTATQSASEFLELYRRTVIDVYSYLRSRVSERTTAEDLTQEVFVAGARRVAAGAVVDPGWLIGVARHKLIDHWRAQEREQRKLVLAHAADRAEDAAPTEAIDPGVAASVLEGLNPTYRAALVLRHVDGLSVAAVAELLGRSVEATEQVLTRARAAFRIAYQGSNHG